MEYSMENVANAANGDTPRGIAFRTKAMANGPRAKGRAKEEANMDRDSMRHRDNKQEKAEARHRG